MWDGTTCGKLHRSCFMRVQRLHGIDHLLRNAPTCLRGFGPFAERRAQNIDQETQTDLSRVYGASSTYGRAIQPGSGGGSAVLGRDEDSGTG